MTAAKGASVHLSLADREEFAGKSILLAVCVRIVYGSVKQLGYFFSFPRQPYVVVKLYYFPLVSTSSFSSSSYHMEKYARQRLFSFLGLETYLSMIFFMKISSSSSSMPCITLLGFRSSTRFSGRSAGTHTVLKLHLNNGKLRRRFR